MEPMNDSTTIPFRKMNGLGNDFVILDARTRSLKITSEIARRVANRSHGIGCDQLIVLEPSDKADAFMRIYNSDGSEVGACGNAARCVALLLAQETGRVEITIETQEAILRAEATSTEHVTIDIGAPKLAWDEIPLAEPFHDTTGIELQIGPIDEPLLHSPSVVNVGNPHVIFWVEDVQAHDLARFGPLLENHPLFPERANISLAQITSRSSLKVRTWERGAGLTKACGTAACAAAVSAARKRFTDRKVTVELPGGPLAIEWADDNHVLMTGPAELEFEGALEADTLSRAQV